MRCIEEVLIGGEDIAVDASMVKAEANWQRHHQDDDDDRGDGNSAIDEYMDALREDGSSIIPAKKLSQTDPMAYCAYSTNYLAGTDARIIVDTEANTEYHKQEAC